VIDACLAITFGNVGRLEVLTQLVRHRVVISARALAEIRRPPASGAIQAAIAAQEITIEAVDLNDPGERQALANFDQRPAFRGRGEAEVLAIAATRGYIVGSDERPVLSAARQQWGAERTASTLDILIWAIREQRLTLPEAETLLARLDVGPGIKKQMSNRGKNLSDLI
jgi:predicted nucleic acid-binding protein